MYPYLGLIAAEGAVDAQSLLLSLTAYRYSESKKKDTKSSWGKLAFYGVTLVSAAWFLMRVYSTHLNYRGIVKLVG